MHTHRLTLHNNPVHNGKSFDDGEAGLGLRQRDLQVVPAAGGPVWSWHPASLMEKPPPREAI